MIRILTSTTSALIYRRSRRFKFLIEMKNLSAILLITWLLTLANLVESNNKNLILDRNVREDYTRTSSDQKQAYFVDQEMERQRIAVGRPVKFKCVVNNIGDHKVAWFHKDKRLLLAVENKTVAWKERIHVSSQANSVFYLTIDNVQLTDKGQFMCQLNTQPAQSQILHLDVVKSPQIKEKETTISIEAVKEFSGAELRCAADGVPKPSIKWRRESQMHAIPAQDLEDEQEESFAGDTLATSANSLSPQMAADGVILQQDGAVKRALRRAPEAPSLAATASFAAKRPFVKRLAADFEEQLASPQQSQNMSRTSPLATTNLPTFIAEGEVLRFDRISRYDMGFYICIASNGVPPSVSQRIFLPVAFVPSKASTNTMKLASPVRSGKTLDSLQTASNLTNGDNQANLSSQSAANNQASKSNFKRKQQHHRQVYRHQPRTAASSSAATLLSPLKAGFWIPGTASGSCGGYKLMIIIISLLGVWYQLELLLL